MADILGNYGQAKAKAKEDAGYKSLQPYAQIAAETAIGFTPAGVVVDIKDLVQAISDRDLTMLAMAGIGFIPGVGDALKGSLKAIHAGDVSAGALARARKELADELAAGTDASSDLAKAMSREVEGLEESLSLASPGKGRMQAEARTRQPEPPSSTPAEVGESAESIRKDVKKATQERSAGTKKTAQKRSPLFGEIPSQRITTEDVPGRVPKDTSPETGVQLVGVDDWLGGPIPPPPKGMRPVTAGLAGGAVGTGATAAYLSAKERAQTAPPSQVDLIDKNIAQARDARDRLIRAAELVGVPSGEVKQIREKK